MGLRQVWTTFLPFFEDIFDDLQRWTETHSNCNFLIQNGLLWETRWIGILWLVIVIAARSGSSILGTKLGGKRDYSWREKEKNLLFQSTCLDWDAWRDKRKKAATLVLQIRMYAFIIGSLEQPASFSFLPILTSHKNKNKIKLYIQSHYKLKVLNVTWEPPWTRPDWLLCVPTYLCLCLTLREEKEEILIIERVEMIVDDDEVGSKRLISYKIYGCQENKAGYLLSDIYSSENSDATIIFLCIFPFTEGLKILGTGNQHQDLSDLKTIDSKTATVKSERKTGRTLAYIIGSHHIQHRPNHKTAKWYGFFRLIPNQKYQLTCHFDEAVNDHPKLKK